MAGRRIALVCAGEAAIGEYVTRLASGLRDNGDRVAVVAPAGFAEQYGLTGVTLATLDVPVTSEMLGDARAAWQLRPMLRGGAGTGPDVVHAFGERAGLAAAVTKVASVPLVTSWWREFELPGTAATDRVKLLPERLIARRSDVSLCATADLVAGVLRLGGRDTRLTPMPTAETVAAPESETDAADPVESVDALYRELIGR